MIPGHDALQFRKYSTVGRIAKIIMIVGVLSASDFRRWAGLTLVSCIQP